MHSHTWSTTLLCTGSLVGLMFVASLPRHSPAPAPAVTAAAGEHALPVNPPTPSSSTVATGASRVAADVAPELAVPAKPQTVIASDQPQTVVIHGRNLSAGLTAKLDGTFESIAFGAHSIVDVTPTSFGLRAAFTQEGTYRLTVRSADGARSNPIVLVVAAVPTNKRDR